MRVEDCVATNEKVCLTWKINIQNPGSDNDDGEKYATTQHVSNIWNTFLLINLSCGKDLKLEIVVVKQVNDQYNLCEWVRQTEYPTRGVT